MTQRLTVSRRDPSLLAWDGRERILVGSGEHYGAVVNRAFDHRRHAAALAADGLDHARLLIGTYHELPGQFGIDGNTLAPEAADLQLAWGRDGDGRWDLARPDPAHLERLAEVLAVAAAHGIAIGLCLFCPCYSDEQWLLHPFHPANNRQGAGADTQGRPVPRQRLLADPSLRPWQLRLLDAVLPVAAAAGNTYVELCNEPYVAAVTAADRAAMAAWQAWLADEVRLRAPELPIAMNLANRGTVVDGLPAPVAIAGMHYPTPEAAWINRGRGIAIAGDETGFQGQDDGIYRRQAWEFLLAGGALFSHLDYSFTPAHPDGDAPITARTPGWGGPSLRRQLGILRRTLAGWDRALMRPMPEAVEIALAPGARAVALGIPGEAVLVHLAAWDDSGLRVCLPAGAWTARWLDPASGLWSEPAKVQARTFASVVPAPDWPAGDRVLELTLAEPVPR
ncbi:MAG: hypothetical protein RLZZ127_1936 [Planctomycetota bacterium]|jgi:hypothetical protein